MADFGGLVAPGELARVGVGNGAGLLLERLQVSWSFQQQANRRRRDDASHSIATKSDIFRIRIAASLVMTAPGTRRCRKPQAQRELKARPAIAVLVGVVRSRRARGCSGGRRSLRREAGIAFQQSGANDLRLADDFRVGVAELIVAAGTARLARDFSGSAAAAAASEPSP